MRLNRSTPVCEWMNQFLYSPVYFICLGMLTLFCNVLGWEAYVYPVIILTGIYICLFARDMLPIFPIFACGYISPSLSNNPGLEEDSIFSLSGAGIVLWSLLVLLAVSLVYRLVTDPDFGGKKFLHKRRSLLPGMLVLAITYAISGLTSGQWSEYGLRNLLFSFIQLVAVAGLYFLLSGAVKWELAPREYLPWTAICVGYILVAEMLNIYAAKEVIVNGAISRVEIATGWGHYNSIGALLTIIIPLSFLLTGKRYGGFAYLSALLFYVILLFTCSRGSILFGTVIFTLSYILSLVHSRNARRQIWMHIGVLALLIFAVARCWEPIQQLFSDFQTEGLESPERITNYREGMKQFLKFPVFGGSFYPVDYWPYAWATADTFSMLFPPRWHNTLVQLLATGGVVCLAGYLFHRVQTIRLFVKDFSTEKLFLGLSVLALLLTSIVDCHFFNVGPVLTYSAVLAFAEFQMNKPEKLQ
ncbi:MAG: O-antigen ligase family protein [Oscillospiraceae bacterium]|nr:O-antigen ligase family protein [Oscillospiraceae bacterium]